MDTAIIIAIGYEGTSSELPGPKYDLANMKSLLSEKFDFQDINILSENEGQKPTKSNILKCLNDVVDNPKLKRLFFYFSGHGTFRTNTDEDEKEEKDQLLCCLNKEYIYDDELYDIFSKLGRGQKVFSLVDSCFSGTISDLNFVYDHEKRETIKVKKREIKANIVQLSSSIDSQTSADTTKGGLMTLNFCNLVRQAKRFTYFNLISFLTDKIGRYQTPYLSSSYKLSPESTFFCSKSERPFCKL